VPRSLTLRPHAKINLFLRVGGLRADGFHEVQTLLQSIALADRMVLTARRGPFVLRVTGAGAPADRTNLVWRAAEALWRALDRSGEPRDVHVALEKQIPTGAGLGGGSSDAAAALVGLNRVWRAGRSVADLARLAAQLGADVPFFLCGGAALGLNRGEAVYPLDDVRRLGVVVLAPSFAVATADAYRWHDEDAAASIAAGAASLATAARIDVGWPAGGVDVINDLTAPVGRRHPDIDEMIAALRERGALAAAMTGSGSAVFGLFSEAGARAAVRRLRRPGWRVLATRTASRREARRHTGL
jgi:4-diphosphocytidyl-2-C-methyl-D-erythritol kinase